MLSDAVGLLELAGGGTVCLLTAVVRRVGTMGPRRSPLAESVKSRSLLSLDGTGRRETATFQTEMKASETALKTPVFQVSEDVKN